MTRHNWGLPRYIEEEYARALRKVARNITEHLKAANEQGVDTSAMVLIAERYADLIEPWAATLVSRVGGRIWRRNQNIWMKQSEEMGYQVRMMMEGHQVSDVVRLWMESQLPLIRSIPVEAAQTVHEAAMKALYTGRRADAIKEVLQAQQGVSESKARLIARTETARAQSTFIQARAEQLGSEGYIWRTAKDYDVRKSHKEMEGKFVRWDHMPELSDGTRCHAGGIYNCRCYPEPILPGERRP